MTRRVQQFTFLLSLSVLGIPALGEELRGTPVAEFAYADASPPMRLPTAVTIGVDGSVYVLDGVHDRIIAFQADGKLKSVIVPVGPALANLPLSQPVGLKAADDGRLWIADSGNGRIVICTQDGLVQETLSVPTIGENRADPTDIAFSTDGSIVWVVDNDGHRVIRYDAATKAWRPIGGLGEALGQWHYPFQAGVNAAGEVFVTDVINARIQMLTADGTAARSLGSYGVEVGQFFRPGGLTVDRENNLWVADSVTGLIQVLRSDGSVLSVLRDDTGKPMRFESPLGLALDQQGALYVVESRGGRVRKLTISKVPSSLPPPERATRSPAAGQQAKDCTICHYDWTPPFSEGRDSSIVSRPIGTHDDPVVSRTEICLSCHDGTVADSRRLVWDEHGHRTGVKPPEGMKVPSELPLNDGKLACRTCHSAHGGNVPQGDFRRAVTVRVANETSQLCGSCHTDKLGGPRFGTHPTGGMPWSIPAPLIEAGAKVGPNTRELTCQVCHTPHGAKFDYLLVMNTSSNQLCLTCHDQMRPGMFRDGAHTEHPLTAKLDPTQVAAVHAMDTRLGPEGQLVCLSCHKLHHGKGGRFLLADNLSEGQMCLRCHENRREMLSSSHDLRTNRPEERNRLGMTGADGGPCSACHLFHRYAREMTPGPGDAAGQCITCHREGACAENKRLGSINHPAVRCTECHNPHEVRFGSFLREPTEDLCASCHADKTLLAGGPHDSKPESAAWCAASEKAGDRCLACHRPHSDEAHGLFRVAPAITEVDGDGACIACHKNVSPDGPKSLLHPRSLTAAVAKSDLPMATDPHGDPQIACATCHDPHGGAQANAALLRTTSSAGGVALCVQCHSDMTQIVATAHSPQAMHEHNIGSAACGPCHQVHGDADVVNKNLLWPDSLVSATAKGGDKYCVECHRAGGVAQAPAIAVHPDVQMLTVSADGATGLPLFDSDGNPNAQGAIGCRTCHLPHGRHMPEVPITAERTPEMRAQRIQLRPFVAPNVCTNCHGVDALQRFLYFHDPERRTGSQASR